MIDLKLLEAEIDIALEKETTDTLLNWLYEKRISDMKKRFGNGVFETLSTIKPIENKKIKNDFVVAVLQPYNNVLSSNNNATSACYDTAA
jgi:hypothetical protein